jgi:hypothetical protein
MWLRIAKKWAVADVNEPLAKYRLSENQIHHNRERLLSDAIKVQEKAFAVSPELRQINQNTRDRCFYDLYLQLSIVYLEKGNRSESRYVLSQYAQSRGYTFRYWVIWLASWTPEWLLHLVFTARRHIRFLWQPAVL